MPRPLLQNIPTDTIFNASSSEALSKAYNTMQQPEKDLLGWLMDLLLATSEHQKVNKMTPQNLSICVAPNLYDVSSSDPMEGLVLSQKVVVFLTNLLNWQAEQRAETAAVSAVASASASAESAAVPQRPGHAPPASLVLRASAAHVAVNPSPSLSSPSSSSTPLSSSGTVTVPLAVPPPPTASSELDSQVQLPSALPLLPQALTESTTTDELPAVDLAATQPAPIAPIAPLDPPPTEEPSPWPHPSDGNDSKDLTATDTAPTAQEAEFPLSPDPTLHHEAVQ
jgi:hypothetical protein